MAALVRQQKNLKCSIGLGGGAKSDRALMKEEEEDRSPSFMESD